MSNENLLSGEAPAPGATPAPSFYDKSPGLVDDIPRAPAVQAPPPVSSAKADAERVAAAVFPSMAPNAETPAEPPGPQDFRHAPMAEEVMPYSPEVELSLIEAAKQSADEAARDNAEEVGRSWLEAFRAHGVPPAEIPGLIEAGHAVTRGELDEATTEEAWPKEARDRLGAAYGADNVDRLVDQARRYVKQHPGLDEWLTRTRLGNHPRVVETIVGIAHRAHKAGRLK